MFQGKKCSNLEHLEIFSLPKLDIRDANFVFGSGFKKLVKLAIFDCEIDEECWFTISSSKFDKFNLKIEQKSLVFQTCCRS